ncbi:MAG: hypothetical protein QNK20_07230 [Aureibaculum sp.]|nr:hypothetical protein [Aureibaculum sp.]
MALLLLSAISLMGLGDSVFNVLLINFFIIFIYVIYKPKNIFHPNNIVFAFSFLYVVLPSSLQLLYEAFNLPYVLPWGQLYDWFSYELSTYYSVFFLYLLLYFSFYFLNQKDLPPRKVTYLVSVKLLLVLFVFTVVMLFFYMQLTGGFLAWHTSYKEAFLLGRDGLGLLNFILLFSVNLLVFLLGLYFHSKKGWLKFSILLISLLLIVFASLLQGLKSRVIILLVIFFFPYLLQLRLRVFVLLLFGALFFVILYIGNYIRTDGFYDTPFVFVEYMMTYFNVYDLHNMVVIESEPGLFNTLHHVFVKPLAALGLISQNAEYDLSVMLTKEYFPLDWESMQATQQWPLITDLYYNYYGFVLGWLPLVVYTFILTILYKKTKSGNVALALIFVLEFFRLFTVQRGVLIPWQIPVYLFFYLFIYFFVKKAVKVFSKESCSGWI